MARLKMKYKVGDIVVMKLQQEANSNCNFRFMKYSILWTDEILQIKGIENMNNTDYPYYRMSNSHRWYQDWMLRRATREEREKFMDALFEGLYD